MVSRHLYKVMRIGKTVYPDKRLKFNEWAKRINYKIYGMHKIKVEKENLLNRICQFENRLVLTSRLNHAEAKEYILNLDFDTLCFNISVFPEDTKEMIKALQMYKRQ